METTLMEYPNSRTKCYAEMNLEERLNELSERDGYIEDGVGLNDGGHEITCDCGCGGNGLYFNEGEKL